MDSFLWFMVDVFAWAVDRWRELSVVAAAAAALLVWACSNLTWVYRITLKDGTAARVGIAAFGRYHRRMREYRSGKDSSTRKGDRWHRQVRWWTPTVPARVARWCRCSAVSPETGQPCLGWSRWFRTVELHRTRGRAKAYETMQIVSVMPLHNHQEIPAEVRRRRRRVAA